MAQRSHDPVVPALTALIAQIERTIEDLASAAVLARSALAARSNEQSWREIVDAEKRPLVVERISQALNELGIATNRLRRAQAQALSREGLATTAIGKLFGISRQRTSVLLNELPRRPRQWRRSPRR